MKYVADFHLHSKYSRAVSPNMILSEMEKFALKKGIDVLTASDFTHPLWLRELKAQLVEDTEGIYKLKTSKNKVRFILSTEISSIYSQGGKTRRIHNLVFIPSLESVEKFNVELLKRGANLSADGRPIIGLSSRNLLELVLSIDSNAFLIPAHCLKPSALIHTESGVKRIADISVGERLYTHRNRKREVTKIFHHNYNGNLYYIRPWYFSLGLETTPEHPFYSFKVKKCTTKGGRCLPTPSHKKICKKKTFQTYKRDWIVAKKLAIGDVLVFPRFNNTTALQEFPIEGQFRGHTLSKSVQIGKEFCRLIGYYLAEGYTNGRDEIAFSFHRNEEEFVEDIVFLMKDVFGISHHRLYFRENTKGLEINFYSKTLVKFFEKLFYARAPFRAINKTMPDWILHLPTEQQAELLRGWWRGDGGYTSSVQLMNSMKVVCLRLGIIPSISKDLKENHLKRGNHQYKNRIIKANKDSYCFSRLAFFEDPYNLLLDPAFKNSIRKLNRRHGWIDEDYIYIPIRKVEKIPYKGEVFNLEVKDDNSYLSEFATVHNCWTPWFALYGSNSGFDSIEECFQDLSKEIYGVETGLSSDPEMNWRIKELDNRSILSFSDAHSAIKMGREATVFDLSSLSFSNIKNAIKRMGGDKISYTIEFYPEEGKYHYTGHRNCRVSQTPEQTRQNGVICPVCKRPLTVGVMERVEKLASTPTNLKTSADEFGVTWVEDPRGLHPKYVKLVPLVEIIAESVGVMPGSLKVLAKFDQIVSSFGSEINVLIKTPIPDIEKQFGERVAQGIEKVRKQDIFVDPGFDGEYGKVKIWSGESGDNLQTKKSNEESQLGLF